jgi:hypothetical protein
MSALAPAPRVRSVDPIAYAPLGSFSCGASSHFEDEVNDGAAKLHRGIGAWEAVRVAETPVSGELMGFCLIQRRSLDLPPVCVADAAYVALIAVAVSWRGCRLPDGGRLGNVILRDALEQIMQLWKGPPMPAVWAMVAPANFASHNVFAQWGFGHIKTGAKYDVRYRPARLGFTPSP